LESQSARNAYETAYLKDFPDACGDSFREFGNAVVRCQAEHQSKLLEQSISVSKYIRHPAGSLAMRGSLENYQTVLNRFRYRYEVNH